MSPAGAPLPHGGTVYRHGSVHLMIHTGIGGSGVTACGAGGQGIAPENRAEGPDQWAVVRPRALRCHGCELREGKA